MDLLRKSGFDFDRHKAKGIPHQLLAEYFTTSGICYNPNLNWITFHGGVDFGYILKVVTGTELPKDHLQFFELMTSIFCNYFDIKEMKRDIDHLSGGLSKVAKELCIDRIGTMHQAGSDSLVTSKVFFKLKNLFSKWW